MLQNIRSKSKSWITFIVIGVIAFMLAITGLESLRPNPNNPDVAKVNSNTISKFDLTQAVNNQRYSIMQRMGDKFNPSMIDEELLTKTTLDQLINNTLIENVISDNQLVISTKELDKVITSIEAFQVDGKFDRAIFQKLLKNANMTPLEFRSKVRNDYLTRQLSKGITETEFSTPSNLKNIEQLQQQTRNIAWTTLNAKSIANSIEISEKEVNDHYQKNKNQYMTDETVSIEYITLKKSELEKSISITHEELFKEYQQYTTQLKSINGDKYDVSTILIEIKKDRTKKQAQEIATNIQKKFNQGELFFNLAKEYSDDPITAKQGGDMGLIQTGFFGKKFDDTLKNLTLNKISTPIETENGLQLILLKDKKATQIPSFEESKNQLTKTLTKKKTSDLYLEQSRKLADISFESSDLTQPAEKFSLKIFTTQPFSRTSGNDLITKNKEVIQQSFSDEVLNQGNNSQLIELSADQSIVLRVKQHDQPQLKKLETVRISIVKELTNLKVKDQLTTKANALIAKLQNKKTKMKKNITIKWEQKTNINRNESSIDTKIITTAFKIAHPIKNQPNYDKVELANGDIIVIRLDKVLNQKLPIDEKRTKLMLSYLSSELGKITFQNYINNLKSKAEIRFYKEKK